MGLAALIAEAKHRMRRRRSLVALLVVLAGLVVGLSFVLRSPSGGPGVPRPLTSSARAGELRVSVPQGLSRYAIGDTVDHRSRVTGQLLTDVPFPGDALTVWGYWSAGPPANGVALGVRLAPGWGRYPHQHVHLPLTLNEAGWFKQKLKDGAVGHRYGFVRFHKEFYLVEYWSGPRAPAADRAAVLRALKSIRPAR